MKIFHTGDWHIGKIVNDYSLLEDQKNILKQLFKLIETKKPDAMIISGDIYDRSLPPKEAVELLDEVLTGIIEEYKLPTFVIAGNHDSQERLSFGSKLFKHKKLYIEGTISKTVKKVTLEDKFGPVNFYLIPYVNPAVIRHLYEDETIKTHQDAFGRIISQVKETVCLEERNVLVTHNFFIGNLNDILMSESERSLSVGGTEYIEASYVEDFDYVALGHLHQHQKVKSDHIRYCGSPLKYSFSEVNHKKGIIMIDLKEKGNLSHQLLELTPYRDMIVIEGELTALLHPSYYEKLNRESYVLAKLTDTGDLYDPLNRLRVIYPNLMQIQRNNFLTNVNSVTKADGDFKNKSKIGLFQEFYNNITGKDMDDKKINILKSIMEEVEI